MNRHLLWAAALLLLPSVRAGADDPVRAAQRVMGGDSNVAHQTAATLSPTNRIRRLDSFHDRTYDVLNRRTRRFDQRFAADPQEALLGEDSRFRAVIYLHGARDNGYEWRLDPDVDADIDLPNLAKRFHVFLQSSDLGELPGVDPSERANRLYAGFRHVARTLNIESDVGIRGNLPPKGFAKLEWKPNWIGDDWTFYPRQRFFYETGDGFGEISSLNANRWLWGRTFLKSVTAARWTENSKGLEWEQSLVVGYVRRYLEPKGEGKIVDDRQTAQGISLRASVFGHKSSAWECDRYRATVTYRRPVHKKWVYLEVSPGVEWSAEANWGAVPVVRVGIDCLFWGPAE